MTAQWMIRNTANILTGPFSREEIVKRVQSRELSIQDEVCPANGYWFALHEDKEVQKHLGIQYPKLASDQGSTRLVEGAEERTDRTDRLAAPAGSASVIASSLLPREASKGSDPKAAPESEAEDLPIWRRLEILIPLVAALLLLFMLRSAFK